MALRPISKRTQAPEVRDDPMGPDVMQRLRTGIGGVLAVIVAVGIAHVITTRALQNEETAVPQAAATVEPSASPTVSYTHLTLPTILLV